MWPALCTTTSRRPWMARIASLAASTDAWRAMSISIACRSSPSSLASCCRRCTTGALRPSVSRMPAYTAWPARASATALIQPKPLEAPVMTMTCLMVMAAFRSDHAAVGAQHLAVHPAAVRTGQERHHAGNVFRRAQALQRRGLGQLLDQRVRLALEEQLGGGRPRRHRVDGD